MSSITFDQSLEIYKSVYFHFLDGLINPEVGDLISNIKNFIKKHNLVTDNINILEIQNISESKKKYRFTNINTKVDASYDIDLDNLGRINYRKLRELFSYCIYQVGQDDHATSFLVFEKDNKLILLIINSGAGIDLNDEDRFSVNVDNKNMYSPYTGVVICDDMQNERKMEKSIMRIFDIFQLSYLYSLLKTPHVFILSSPYQHTNQYFLVLPLLKIFFQI